MKSANVGMRKSLENCSDALLFEPLHTQVFPGAISAMRKVAYSLSDDWVCQPSFKITLRSARYLCNRNTTTCHPSKAFKSSLSLATFFPSIITFRPPLGFACSSSGAF